MDARLQEEIRAEAAKGGISEAMAWHVVMTREIQAGRIIPLSAEGFDPSQSRDEQGRWTETGGGGMTFEHGGATFAQDVNGDITVSKDGKQSRVSAYQTDAHPFYDTGKIPPGGRVEDYNKITDTSGRDFYVKKNDDREQAPFKEAFKRENEGRVKAAALREKEHQEWLKDEPGRVAAKAKEIETQTNERTAEKAAWAADRQTKMTQAKSTGVPVLVNSYVEYMKASEGGERGEYAFRIMEHADPDGTIKTTRVRI
jgi:hypothetical protein